jgi:hypothetical protein
MEHGSVVVAIAVMALVVDSVGVLISLVQLMLDLSRKHEDKENRQKP